MRKVAAYTLGCKVNQYETEAVLGSLMTEGYQVVDFDKYADIYIINTCTVTGLADRKCRQILRKAKKINPQAVVVAMGCYSQIAANEVSNIKDVNIVIGTNGRSLLAQMLSSPSVSCDSQIICVENIMNIRKFEELGLETYTEHTRAFLKIQDGCNRFCSYCIIPYARGPIRSREPQNILKEIEKLTEQGYSEFVLTGIHLASYGVDLKNTNLVDIIRKVLLLDGVERLRLGSIEPMTVTEDFLKLVSESEKLCPHFHISLQSGSNNVLKRMNRRYTAEEYYEKCIALKSVIPDLSFTTDIIVGFPGESDSEFKETCEFVEKIGFSKVHVFKFSPRKGTPAAEMANQILPEIKDKRSSELIGISDKLAADFSRKLIGKKIKILIEKKRKDGMFEGHSENYSHIICSAENISEDLCGKIVSVMVEKHDEINLYGVLQS